MFNAFKFFSILLIAILMTSIGTAQDNLYQDIPTSRTDDGGFVLGSPDAPIKLIEFADFLCPHCQDYKATVDNFIEDYVATGQAQFEYRMFPIVDPNLSPLASSLVECADNQSEGLFWQAHDVMFDLTSSTQFSQASVAQFAENLGLDVTQLSDCTVTATQYVTDATLGSSLGVSGTPTVAVQYADAPPIIIAPPSIDQLETIINSSRPTANEPVTIKSGRYEGMQTFRTENGGIVLGNPSVSVTVVAFEDFMCPHCQDYQPTVHTFVENYVATGEANFEYRFFPLVSPEYSMLTAQVADCIALQDLSKFWDAHDLLFDFASSGEIDENIASVIAMLVGLDADDVMECVDTSIQPLIDQALGRSMQVTGTPGIRARGDDGQLYIIYAGQQPLDRGALPIEALSALIDGTDNLAIGQPDVSVLSDSYLLDDSLITNEPCKAPCWQNIVPGETTLVEASIIIQQLATATIVQEAPNGFAFTVDSLATCCQIISQDSAIVSTIFLQLAPNITLGNIIETHGEPTFVNGEPFSDNEAILWFFYPELNTIIYTVVDGVNGQLSSESPIFNVIYASPELMQGIIASGPLDDWKGFLSYNDYMDGEFDNNP